jgi:hypothetical protein
MKYKLTDKDLFNVAKAFEQMLPLEYGVLLGDRKHNLTELKIVFDKSGFKHITGLHKLEDKPLYSMSSYVVFEDMLNGKIKATDITSSRHYNADIEKRILSVKNIQQYLDGDTTIYRWDRYMAHSDINAQYMVKAVFQLDAENKIAFVFLTDNNDTQRGNRIISFFPESRDLSVRQSSYTTLQKSKINIHTRETQVLYRHPNFKPLLSVDN